MREIKKSSSMWIHNKIGLKSFAWQEGYAAFTVSASACDKVCHYIAHQQEHHRKKTSKEELLELLIMAGVNYDRFIYGHPLLLAETFVDPSRFLGTCYLAQGWILLGHTRGFGKKAGKYYKHGLKKMIFAKPLSKQTLRILSDPLCQDEILCSDSAIMNLKTPTEKQANSLIDAFRKIPDPRSPKGREHSLIAILSLSVCATLSGAKTFLAIGDFAGNASQTTLKRLWCRYDKTKKRFIAPCEATIRQTLNKLNSEILDEVLSEWLLSFVRKNTEQKRVIAIDGKTLRGSRHYNTKPVHLFSALLHREGVVLAQKRVPEKTNEINAVVPLFAGKDIADHIITADAMHCQKKQHVI